MERITDVYQDDTKNRTKKSAEYTGRGREEEGQGNLSKTYRKRGRRTYTCPKTRKKNKDKIKQTK